MGNEHLTVGNAEDMALARETARSCAALSERCGDDPRLGRAQLALEAMAIALRSCDPAPTDEQVNAILELIQQEIETAKAG